MRVVSQCILNTTRSIASRAAGTTTHNSPAVPAGVGATDEVKFYYDTQSLPTGAPSYTRGSAIGRLVAQTYGTGSNGDYYAYDVLGRETLKIQQTGTVNYQMSAAYNLSGTVGTLTYPSGHTVTQTYDQAGRLTTLSGNLGDGTTRTYTTGIIYSALGAIVKEQFGTTTPIYNKLFYNSRGQLAEIRESTSYTGPTDYDANRGAIINSYSNQCTGLCSGANMSDNNGNLIQQDIQIPSVATRSQYYEYDTLSRLKSAREVMSSVEQWKQGFTYDRWGNRIINTGVTYGTGINNKAFTVNTANNRLGVPVGQPGVMTYDGAGNLTNDTYTGMGGRTYDAENKMTQAADNTGQISRYTYDSEGKRVRRQVASGQEDWQIYGFDGELLAEYRASAPASSPQKEYGFRNGQLLVTATGRYNVALAANGAVATASSTATGSGFSTTGAINGNYRGPWGNNVEGWNDWTPNVLPDWLQVDFAGSKTIDEISVFSLHDNYTVENTPTETQTFSLYGLLAFDVQYWNGSSWVTVPGGSVTGNNKVWRKFTFSPITTSKLRVTINAVPDSWSRVVEIQAFGTSAGDEKLEWLVADQLGTPRMIFDQTGNLASMKRHDYLPFGEELFAGVSGRSAAQGYSVGDAVRQQFTSKERDVETGLDYFGARYYASMQGRFTGADPYNINLERQQSGNSREAGVEFLRYISEPQHWNQYSYVLNNPLKFVDPDGWKEKDNEFTATLLGQEVTVVIDKKVLKQDPDAKAKVKEAILKAFDKINKANEAKPFSAEEIKTINRLDKIKVTQNGKGTEGMVGNTFHLQYNHAANPNTDVLSGNIMHDARHAEQKSRGLDYNNKNAIPMEMEASSFVVGIIATRGWSESSIQGFRNDAQTGHVPREGFKDKSTPESRQKVFDRMKPKSSQ
jgi:RHS repeat-associated protein